MLSFCSTERISCRVKKLTMHFDHKELLSVHVVTLFTRARRSRLNKLSYNLVLSTFDVSSVGPSSERLSVVLLISHMLNASLLNLNWHVHATTSLFCEKVDDPSPDTLPVKFLTLPPKNSASLLEF